MGLVEKRPPSSSPDWSADWQETPTPLELNSSRSDRRRRRRRQQASDNDDGTMLCSNNNNSTLRRRYSRSLFRFVWLSRLGPQRPQPPLTDWLTDWLWSFSLFGSFSRSNHRPNDGRHFNNGAKLVEIYFRSSEWVFTFGCVSLPFKRACVGRSVAVKHDGLGSAYMVIFWMVESQQKKK